MEDQEREPRTEEDVEAHSNYGAPAKGAPAKGREDEGDDVEAHVNIAAPAKGAPAKG
jgi:hypothetical protein